MPGDIQRDHLLDGAIACHQAGQRDRAAALYHTILREDPDDLDALNLLGLLLQDAGDLDGSIRLLSRAVDLDPEFAEAFANLARAQYAAGDAGSAAVNASRAARLDPMLTDAHALHGRALLVLGRNDEAASACGIAVSLAPTSAEIQADYGFALARIGAFEAAIEAFDAALRLRPGVAPVLNALAMSHMRLRHPAKALACAQEAVELAPNDAETCLGLAYALRESRQVAESVDVCRRTLELAPECTDAWVLRGDNLVALGRFDEAISSYNRALETESRTLDAIAGLARISQLQADSPHADGLRKVVADIGASSQARSTACFALGSALDRMGSYEEAFANFEMANRLLRDMIPAEERAKERLSLTQRVDWLIDVFSAELFHSMSGCGDDSQLPVFVVGMPRSGTTLVEQIAASHPGVFGGGECADMPDIAGRLEGGLPATAPVDWDKSLLRSEAQSYIARVGAAAGGAARRIDKLPDNILLLGHIALLFPKARIVVCRRDLRDVGISCFSQKFRDGLSWNTDLADCAWRACEIERIYYHWRSVLPLRVLDVQYEELIRHPESESRRLIEFLGLAWDPACLAFHRTDRPVLTASTWQVRQPVYTSSVGRWRNYRGHIQTLLEGLAGAVPADDAEQRDLDPGSALATARQHIEAGRLAAAETTLRALLAAHPDIAEALRMIAGLLVSRGSLQPAEPLLRHASELNPNDAAALVELALLYGRQGDFRKAAVATEQACARAPQCFEAHRLLGELRLNLDEPDAAERALGTAVKLDPTSLQAKLQLAIALLQLGKRDQAAESLKAALEIDPNHVECLSKLGFVLSTLDRHQEALDYHEQAVALSPEEPRALYGLVLALWRKQDITRTHEVCSRVLELSPDDAQVWHIRGLALAALGRFREAEASFRRALEIHPDFADVRLALADLRLDVEDHTETEQLHSVLSDTTKSATARASAGFALGMILDTAGNYDAAFAAIAEANRLVREGRGAPVPVDVDLVKRNLSREHILAAATRGESSELPVFIVGMPRSGTTLVEQILASHPAVAAGGERKDIGPMVSRLGNGDTYTPPTQWNPLSVAKEVAWYLAEIQDLAGDALRFTDKMPDNLLFLGHIGALLPGSRVIVCRRDLRDVCLSCFFQRFGDPTLDWSNDLKDLAVRAQNAERLIEHWRNAAPLRILEVQYETLVSDLEAESRRLIDFLGLEWDPACLAFHETERAVLTASQWQVRQPIYTNSVGRWRLYEKHLGPLVEGLREYLREDSFAG